MIPDGYEYKYYSAQYNNRLFDYPQIIDNNNIIDNQISNHNISEEQLNTINTYQKLMF